MLSYFFIVGVIYSSIFYKTKFGFFPIKAQVKAQLRASLAVSKVPLILPRASIDISLLFYMVKDEKLNQSWPTENISMKKNLPRTSPRTSLFYVLRKKVFRIITHFAF